MIWVRGDPLEYDHWESLGNTGWGLSGVLPYLKRMEQYEQGDSDFRGREGPMYITRYKDRDPLSEGFIAASEQAAGESLRVEPVRHQLGMRGIVLEHRDARGPRRLYGPARHHFLPPALHSTEACRRRRVIA